MRPSAPATVSLRVCFPQEWQRGDVLFPIGPKSLAASLCGTRGVKQPHGYDVAFSKEVGSMDGAVQTTRPALASLSGRLLTDILAVHRSARPAAAALRGRITAVVFPDA